MPITLVKIIDVYAGALLFLVCNLLAALPFSSRRAQGPPRRILVVKFWGLGSILLLQPLVRALRRAHPAAEITLLTLSRNRGLLPLLPAVDGMLTLDLEEPLRVPFRILALGRRVATGRFDLVVDCEFFAKLAAILTFVSRAPVRVGFHRDERLRRRLYTAGVPFRHDRHVTAAFAALLGPLGIPVDPADHRAPPPSPAADAEAEALLADVLGDPRGIFVAVNPNASELAYERRWPADRFAELARRVADAGIPTLLVGSPQEKPYVDAIVRDAARPGIVHGVAGRTTLVGLQALLLRSRLFVSNDSGPLHLAATSGVPCLALFGPETPDLYGPVGTGHLVLYRRLPCSPCMSVHDMKQVVCHGQIDCLREIGVEEVLAGVLARLHPAARPAVLAAG